MCGRKKMIKMTAKVTAKNDDKDDSKSDGKNDGKGDGKDDGARLEDMYRAIVLGLRDYVRKNGFSDVILGLSGGIDSASLCCACC